MKKKRKAANAAKQGKKKGKMRRALARWSMAYFDRLPMPVRVPLRGHPAAPYTTTLVGADQALGLLQIPCKAKTLSCRQPLTPQS